MRKNPFLLATLRFTEWPIVRKQAPVALKKKEVAAISRPQRSFNNDFQSVTNSVCPRVTIGLHNLDILSLGEHLYADGFDHERLIIIIIIIIIIVRLVPIQCVAPLAANNLHTSLSSASSVASSTLRLWLSFFIA